MFNIENQKLTISMQAGSMVIELPAVAVDSTVHVWKVPTDYRANGIFASVQGPGHPQEVPACDINSNSCQYLGAIDYPAATAERLAAQKRDKLIAINAACDAAVFSLTDSYPAAEIQSWPQQVKEADAFCADAGASVPLLQSIAAQRGLELADIVQRVNAKVHAYAIASGVFIGMRQALEDALNDAQTIEDVLRIEWAA